ncbi:MAG: SDR family oxidoreductase [Actinobacteria bacterium]|nr:SDR family oxidoreductase [Actinomycetota bacterium]
MTGTGIVARFDDLVGKRVLLTSAGSFMGPTLAAAFGGAGCDVVADPRDLADPAAPDSVVAEAAAGGPIDVVLANLGVPAAAATAVDQDDESWLAMFDHLIHPLMRLVRASLPAMIERGHGKIVVLGSSSALKPIRRSTPYATARGAQLTYVRYVGVEVAAHNVQVNAIAQNYIANPTYYPPELVATERFRKSLQRNVPADRLGRPEDTAQLALFLASGASDFMSGVVVPLDGGWSV